MNWDEIKRRLAGLDPAVLTDVNKRLRVMAPELGPITTGLKMIGIARTVRCQGDFLTVLAALSEARDDEVLVVDAEGSRVAVAGELFASEALRRGLAGIVIDGACRDTAKIRSLAIPVYSRWTNPCAGTVAKLYETQVPICCGGVIVTPGDVLFGDDDGVVVASMTELHGIISAAEEIQGKEERMLSRIAHGESLFAMLNLPEHLNNVKAGRASRLRFEP